MEIHLRPFTNGDLPRLKRWLGMEHVKPWFEHPQSWLAEVRGRAGEYAWIRHFILCSDGEPVGFCQFYPYWKSGENWHGKIPTEGTYSIDYLVGEPSFLRRDCARQALFLTPLTGCFL